MSTSIKTRPSLWEKVKKEVIRSPKGGPIGKWSARKAQRAVSIYKEKGGGYVGKKSPKNSLAKWSSEKWGYINDINDINDTKKSKSKKKYGRYLPLEVRKKLSPREKRIENSLKNKRYGEWVPYSKSVATKVNRVKKSKRKITSTKSKRRTH
jgi:hypothetical protein